MPQGTIDRHHAESLAKARSMAAMYQRGISTAEIGHAFGVSRARVQQLLKLAERMDPVKLNIPVDDPFVGGSRRMAHEAIARAMTRKATNG